MSRLNKIAIKLSLFSSVLILTVIAVMAHFILNEARSSLVSEMKLRTDSFARTAREAFTPRLDIFTLHLRVNEMAKEPAAEYALITDPAGRMLSHSIPDRIGETDASPEGDSGRAASSLLVQSFDRKGSFYYISAPIYLGEARVATAAIAVTDRSLNAALASRRRRILLISLAALIAALVGTILIVNWFMKPIPMLARAAGAIGEGRLDTEVAWKGSDEIGLLTKAFNNMARGLRERDHIRRVLGRYVSKAVADTLLTGPLALGGENREVTVLFADIRDFTRHIARSGPEEVVRLLNDYFSRMTRIIQDCGGNIDKFIGDGILAMFGAPIAARDPVRRALKAAARMLDSVAVLNAERVREGLEPISIGIAVAHGRAVVGNIGSEDRSEYTAIGEPVNLAVRMEGINKRLNTTIIVSSAARALAEPDFLFRSLGEHNVRGWTDPVEIFELAGEPGNEPRSTAAEK